MSKFKVGQTVTLEDRRGGTEEKTIVRVGRKWVYIEQYGYEVAFDAQTGHEKNRYGFPSRIYTAETKAEEERRNAVLKELEHIGIQLGHGDVRQRLSTATFEAILAAIPESERP